MNTLKWKFAEQNKQVYGTDKKYWYLNVCMDIEDPVKQRYSWQGSDTSVRSWKRDLYDRDFNYITITVIINTFV